MLKFSQILDGQKIYENDFRSLSPKVSIIMPTYCRNADGMLVDCIESIINQTYKDFEFIIVDDGSTDGSQQVIETFARQDPRIVYVRHDINSGLPAVRTNEGILLARSPLIAFIFDDNVWKPDALQILVTAVEETGAEMVYGDVEMTLPNNTAKRFGVWPITMEALQLTNTIPNGGVLCRRVFFEKYGLYDPHLILRRTCDWDLWKRALKSGAFIRHIQATVGIEHGVVSPVSLGNTVHLDFKVSTAYANDDRNLAARIASLLPNTIQDYDILDPEKVMPYIRDFNEWGDIELKIYQPFLEKHPEYNFMPPARHNRRYDPGISGYALNPPSAVFKRRQRILLAGTRYDRVMKDWHEALSADQNMIVVTFSESVFPLLSTRDYDCLILFDCCSLVEHNIEQFRKQGTCVIYVVDHGLDEIHVDGDPLQLLHLENYDEINAFVMGGYFPTNGYPWNSEEKEIANELMEQSDQVFSIQPDRGPACPVKFYPTFIKISAPAQEIEPKDIVLYLGDPGNINAEQLRSIYDSLSTKETGSLFLFEGSSLPEGWQVLFPKWRICVINDSIFSLLDKMENTCFIVADQVLTHISEYAFLLMLEDQVQKRNLIIPVTKLPAVFDDQIIESMWSDLIVRWDNLVIGNRADERFLYIQNLVSGVLLRKKIADMQTKPYAHNVRTAILINSLLFGGSESYGLTVSEKLRDLGFDVIVAGPVTDVYKAGTDKINNWLSAHRFPPLKQVDYGLAAYQIFGQTPDEKEVVNTSKKIGEWFEQNDVDIIFCSGFIAEPAIIENLKRIVYMALFPPWGYNLANMTFLKNRISGLVSDTRWGLDFWTSWFPTTSEVTRSLIDREYFQVLNNDLPDKPVRLAIMGTIIHTKRQREAILAVRQLIQEGYDLQLNIYGHLLDVYKDYSDELLELAREPLLIDRIKFYGFIEDPHQVARENHIILSCSIAEGLPQALIFNQASGLLPVACPAGGIPEVIIDGENGFLADGFEVENIVNALRRALSSQSTWPLLIENGRKLLLDQCTESEFMHRLLKVMITGADIKRSQGARLFRNRNIDIFSDSSKKRKVRYAGLQIGPTLSKRKVIYEVEAHDDVIRGYFIQLGTHSTQPRGEIKFTIFLNGDSDPLREVKLDLNTIHDNQWVKVTFEPIFHSMGNKFQIEVVALLIEGRVALYESSLADPSPLDILRSRMERWLHKYIQIPYKKSAPAFFPVYD